MNGERRRGVRPGRALGSVVVVAVLLAFGSQPETVPVDRTAAGPPASTTSAAAATGWCGAGRSAVDRKPDLEPSSERLVHVLYALPADAEDRFDELAGAIVTDVAAIDAWWRAEDPTRAPRWDLYPFGTCSGPAALDLGFVRLPRAGAEYADSDALEPLVRDLGPVIGRVEKSVVFYDGPRSNAAVCGSSLIAPLYAGRFAFSFVWLRSSCAGDVGSARAAAVSAAHELVHSLGAVQSEGPPNRCRDASRSGHVCDDAADLMFPYSSSRALAATRLDTGHDDYYGHTAAWWDVQDSPWLTRLPQRRLVVSVLRAGGAGSVLAGPSGLACPGTCTTVWDDGLRLRLRATAEPGSRLRAWSGACTGRDSTCGLTIGGPTRVTATFGPLAYRVSVTVRGRGRIVSEPAGLVCGSSCGAWFAPGARVRLRPISPTGSRFERWAGACSGRGSCVLTADRDRSVTATFVRR